MPTRMSEVADLVRYFVSSTLRNKRIPRMTNRATLIQFEPTPLNKWKKFLLSIPLSTVRSYLNYWSSFKVRSENTNNLIKFCKEYLQDLEPHGLNGRGPPAEFNLAAYSRV